MAYVYWLTHNDTGEYYIGYTTKQIGVNYFTSSKHISYSPETVDEWTTEIVFEGTKEEAFWKENELIREHIKDPKCINANYRREDQTAGELPVYVCNKGSAQRRWERDDAGRARVAEWSKQQWQDPEYREGRAEYLSEKCK